MDTPYVRRKNCSRRRAVRDRGRSTRGLCAAVCIPPSKQAQERTKLDRRAHGGEVRPVDADEVEDVRTERLQTGMAKGRRHGDRCGPFFPGSRSSARLTHVSADI